jgi:hypothetical protein
VRIILTRAASLTHYPFCLDWKAYCLSLILTPTCKGLFCYYSVYVLRYRTKLCSLKGGVGATHRYEHGINHITNALCPYKYFLPSYFLTIVINNYIKLSFRRIFCHTYFRWNRVLYKEPGKRSRYSDLLRA